MEKEEPNQKTKKTHHSLNKTDLNQRQKKKEEEAPNTKKKKNPSQPKPEGLKAKAIKWKKKSQIKKPKKSIID